MFAPSVRLGRTLDTRVGVCRLWHHHATPRSPDTVQLTTGTLLGSLEVEGKRAPGCCSMTRGRGVGYVQKGLIFFGNPCMTRSTRLNQIPSHSSTSGRFWYETMYMRPFVPFVSLIWLGSIKSPLKPSTRGRSWYETTYWMIKQHLRLPRPFQPGFSHNKNIHI